MCVKTELIFGILCQIERKYSGKGCRICHNLKKMSIVSCRIVILTLHLTLVDGLLLDNINNQQTTTPSSSSHQDTLIFLMQEVMQIKNILPEKTREIGNLRSAVFNESSSMFFNLTRELQTLKNGSNNSNDILKLRNEIAVLKFTVENELANRFQTLSSSNMTDMFSKLSNLENAVRHFTLVLNQKVSISDLTQALTQKVSTSELAAVEQRLTTLSTKLEAQIKNITESVITLQQGKTIPGKYWAVILNTTICLDCDFTVIKDSIAEIIRHAISFAVRKE